MPSPSMVIRIAANLEELKAQLATGAFAIETTTNKMVSLANSYSGARTVQQAHDVMGAIDAVGGVTSLTAKEQASANRILDEAIAKYAALGREAPAEMLAVADAIKRGTTQVESFGVVTVRAGEGTQAWTSQLHAFDGVLASLGIHIGPEIKGLTELGAAGGATAGSLGLIATAGLALGAGIAGWKIGRLVADFFDLDETIANATAKLLHFGDVAAQVAGANADKLAEASRRAKREITDLAEATRILNQGVELTYNNYNISASAIAGWQREIRKVRAEGDLPQLTEDLASQNFKLEDLAKRYHTSVDALQYFQREQAKAAEQAKQTAADRKQQATDIADSEKTLQEVSDKVWKEMEIDYQHLADVIAKESADIMATLQAEIATMHQAASSLHDSLYGAPEQDFGGELQNKLDRLEALRGTPQAEYYGLDIDQAERDLIEQENRRQIAAPSAGGLPGTAPKGTGSGSGASSSSFAGGGMSGGGSFATLPTGAITSSYLSGIAPTGYGMSPNVTINVTQPLGTPQAIADVVGGAMKTVIQQGR